MRYTSKMPQGITSEVICKDGEKQLERLEDGTLYVTAPSPHGHGYRAIQVQLTGFGSFKLLAPDFKLGKKITNYLVALSHEARH